MKEYRHVVYKGLGGPAEQVAQNTLNRLNEYWKIMKDSDSTEEGIKHSHMAYAGTISGVHILMLVNEDLDTLITDCMNYAVFYQREVEKLNLFPNKQILHFTPFKLWNK